MNSTITYKTLAKMLKKFSDENGESSERRQICRAISNDLSFTSKEEQQNFLQECGISPNDIG